VGIYFLIRYVLYGSLASYRYGEQTDFVLWNEEKRPTSR